MEMDKSKRREIFGWAMYDFANSAFATTILAAVLPIYFASLVPDRGILVSLFGREILFPATSLWAYTVSFSLLIVAFSSPILGAIADYSGSKKKFLAVYCYLGCIFTTLLYFVESGDYLLAMFLFLVANIGFAGGNVFYNAFLPTIAKEDDINWVSGKGFAFGYLGGGLLLILNLLLITKHDFFGLSDRVIGTRVGFVTVGVWWAVMSIPIFVFVRERGGKSLPAGKSYLSMGFQTIMRTLREIRKYKQLTLFLIAFLIYNDAIQTIVAMSTIFGKVELGLSEGTLIGALLMTQFIALPGSLVFAKIATRFGAKNSIMLTLFVWSAIVIYAYFIETALEFWVLAGTAGLVLGGTQAISRSLYASFIPKQNSAEFFGFFAISNKFASILGPLTFALVGQLFGSARASISSLIVFLIIGMIVLSRVNPEEGVRQSKTAILSQEG